MNETGHGSNRKTCIYEKCASRRQYLLADNLFWERWRIPMYLAKKERAEKNNDGSLYFEYSKPGGSFAITILPGGAKSIVKTTQFTAAGTMVGFHRVHGYGGGWLYDFYILMMDLASIATILFGMTGLYLWYKLMRKKKKWGIIILTGSFGYTIMIILWLMNN